MKLSALVLPSLAATASALEAASNLEPRDFISDISKDIVNAFTQGTGCAGCQTLVGLLKIVAALGDTVFVDTLTEVCKLSGAEDPDVCTGAIALEGPIIAHDLRNIILGSKTSDLFCITFMGLCSYPAVSSYTPPFPSAKPSGSRPPPSGQSPIQIVHYSDIHIDPFYVTGSASNCTKPICCRDYNSQDAPGNNSSPAGPNGDHNCDAPVSLEQSMYAAIKQFAPNAAFSIFTGDIVDHAIWNTTVQQNTIDINDAYNKMGALGMPIYGTVGNHESSPVNAFQTIMQGNGDAWVYDLISADLSQWIGPSAASEELAFGAYSTIINGNLRLISINTNMYYIQNYWLYEEPMEDDPSGQFTWLVSELAAAEAEGQRVYIIGHMPMGSSDAFHDGSFTFDAIVNRYSNTIAAMFFGHTHVDQFEVSYSDYNNRAYDTAVAMSYIIPSMTPTSGMPAFRVYDVDPVTFAVLDSTTYIADMTNPAYQSSGPVWTKYYSAKDTYGPLVSPALPSGAELSPAFWHNVTAALQGDQNAFNAYYARKSRGWHVQSCTGFCLLDEVCQMRAGRAQDNCYTPQPGIHFSKRDGTASVTSVRDECGISVTREVLGLLGTDKGALEHFVGKAQELSVTAKM